MKRIAVTMMALSLITAFCLNVSAADTTASSAQEDTASSAAGSTAAASDTTDTTALKEAWEAYRTAKAANELTDYEDELKAMVTAGQLTQDQADLLLEAAQSDDHDGTGSSGRHGTKAKAETTDKTASTDTDDAAADDSEDSTDTTALKEAREAYRTAKKANALTEYEDDLEAMVTAGQLTQDQADLLLEAAQSDDHSSIKHGSKTDSEAATDTTDTTDTTDAAALKEARQAYRTAKAADRQADFEAELKAMVKAGQLTEDQADLLLNADTEKTALHQSKDSTAASDSDSEDSDSDDASSTKTTHGGHGGKR